MRIVCISDTHTKKPAHQIPDGDILIHAGDSTFQGSIAEINGFDHWLGTLPHKHKIVIAGNHDWLFQTNPGLAKSLITNAKYLQDEWVVVEGLTIYGSPWQPAFCDWAFNLERGAEIKRKWDQIPEGIDILVTHGPPQGILDQTPRGEAVGCKDLFEAIMRVKPKLHVFGHIHEGHGIYHFNGITFVNASICDGRYLPINPPIVIDL